MTEDDYGGRLYRFTPDTPRTCPAARCEAASVGAGGAVTWVNVSPKAPYRGRDTTVFDRGEGAWIDKRRPLLLDDGGGPGLGARPRRDDDPRHLRRAGRRTPPTRCTRPTTSPSHDAHRRGVRGRGRATTSSSCSSIPSGATLGGRAVPPVRRTRRLGGHRPGVLARRHADVRQLAARLRRGRHDVRDHRTLRRLIGMRARAASVAVLVAGVLALAAPAQARARPADAQLAVVAFNVLAPVWASPVWYPEELDPALLDAAVRRERIAAFLAAPGARRRTSSACRRCRSPSSPRSSRRSATGSTGAMALQRSRLVVELGRARDPVGAERHRRDRPAQRVPLDRVPRHRAVRRRQPRARSSRASTGRRAARVRAASVHLDSDKQANRKREARSLDRAAPGAARGRPTWSAATSTRTPSRAPASGVFERAGFTDALAAVGNREPTHPWSSSYNGAPRWGIIDHSSCARRGR